MIRKLNGAQLFYFLLIFSIFFGVFIRFYDIGSGFMWRDEAFTMISAIKYNHNNSYDPRWYIYEQPALSRWIQGLPTRFIDADYSPALWMPQNMYVWSYISYGAIKQAYSAARYSSAVLGALSIFLVYLLGKEIYGKKEGLWSAAIMALSFDYLTYSRIIFPEISMVFFTLLTLYFYILYLKSDDGNKRIAYLVLSAAALSLALITRGLQPVFLFVLLAVSQFFLNSGKNKKLENLLFVVLLAAAYYFAFYLVWTPEMREAEMTLNNVTLASVLTFNFTNVISSLFLRNSYLFSAALLVAVCAAFFLGKTREEKNEGKKDAIHLSGITLLSVRKYFASLGIESVILMFFFINFFAFGISTFGNNHRYMLSLYIPIILLSGKYLEAAISKEKRILWLMIALILVNIYGIIAIFPNFHEYSNFGKSQFGNMNDTYNSWTAIRESTDYLKNLNYPPIISNDINALMFYPGNVTHIPIPHESSCTPEYIEYIKSRNFRYVLYHDDMGEDTVFSRHRYFCPYFVNSSYTKLATFGKKDVIQLYKIN